MSDTERDSLLALCLERDGDIDLHLVLLTGRDMGPVKDPTLDHLNGDKTDHRPENVVRVERSSNSREGNYARKGGRGRLLTPGNVDDARAKAREWLSLRAPAPGSRGGESEGEKERERVAMNRRGYASTDDPAGLFMLAAYRLYVFRVVKEDGYITREDAINGGAEALISDPRIRRGSQVTIERYFAAIISRNGWLVRDPKNTAIWVFKPGRDLKELEQSLLDAVEEMEPKPTRKP